MIKNTLNGKVLLSVTPDSSTTVLAEVLARRISDGEMVKVAVGTGTVESVTGNVVDNTDPDNPVINIDLAAKADLVAGKVPAAQLPSYVDDVIEVADFVSLPVTGETGKLYVTLDTELLYRWTGTIYAEISPTQLQTLQSVTDNGNTTSNDIEFEDGYEPLGIRKKTTGEDFEGKVRISDTGVELVVSNVGETDDITLLQLNKPVGQLQFSSQVIGSRGIIGSEDYTPNITDLDFVQKKYVDDAVSAAGGGTVTSVSGTTNEITVSNPTTTPVIGISSAYTSARDAVANGKVTDAIVDGVTTVAPSQNAVFDALAGKVSTSGNETVAGVKTFSSAPVMSAGGVISNGFSISNSISTILQLFFGDASNSARAQRNTADAIPAFITRNANSSSTGNIHNFESNIGGTTIARAFVARNGDIEITTAGGGVILKSPSGTRYKITVSDAGVLTTTLA